MSGDHEKLYRLLDKMAMDVDRAAKLAGTLDEKLETLKLAGVYRKMWSVAKLNHFEYEDAAKLLRDASPEALADAKNNIHS